MAGLKKTQQLLLIGISQNIARSRLRDASALELLKQGVNGLLKLVGKIGDSGV